MQLDVAHTLFYAVHGCDVSDILSAVLPTHIVSALTHQTTELLFRPCVPHTEIDVGAEPHLPAVTLDRRMVLPRTEVSGLLLRIVGRQCCQAVRLTDAIALRAEGGEVRFARDILDARVDVVGADDEMIVQMLAVDMRRHEDFAVAKLLGKFASDLVDDLRLDVFIG